MESNKRAILGSASLDFGSIAASGTGELTITVPGVAAGDIVALGAPAALTAGLVATAYASAADTVTVRVLNTTVAAVDAPAQTWKVAVIK